MNLIPLMVAPVDPFYGETPRRGHYLHTEHYHGFYTDGTPGEVDVYAWAEIGPLPPRRKPKK